jgi:ketosteroid isomerase-like protein
MRKLVTVLVPVALIATSIGCAPRRHAATVPPHPCTPKQAATGARNPEDLDRLFGERLNAGDVDGVVALYEPTATLVRQDRSAAIGTAAIHEEIAGFAALRPHITLNVFRVLTGGADVAVVYDDWTATGTDPKGKHLEFSGHASEVVRRGPDGSWRFIVDDPDARSAPSTSARRHGPAKRKHK